MHRIIKVPHQPNRSRLPAVLLFSCWLSLLVAFAQSGLSQQSAGDTPGKRAAENPAGVWRGESKCVVKPSDCNDEDSVYRFTTGESPDRMNLSASKLVDGREVKMGSADCGYIAKSGEIDCALPNGNSMHFEVKGSAIEGTMRLRVGTLWRRISLHKVEQ